MDVVDRELSESLAQIAAHYRPQPDAWAEQQRRQLSWVRRRRRYLSLTTAVAAAVLVGAVTVPVVLIKGTSTSQQPVAPADQKQSASHGQPATSVGPVKALEYSNGAPVAFWIYVERKAVAGGGIEDSFCGAYLDPTESLTIDEAESGRDCITRLVESPGRAQLDPVSEIACDHDRPDVHVDCMNIGAVVVAAAPDVARLEVRVVGGQPVSARELGRTAQFVLLIADFTVKGARGPKEGQRFIHTARDSRGDIIEEVTLG